MRLGVLWWSALLALLLWGGAGPRGAFAANTKYPTKAPTKAPTLPTPRPTPLPTSQRPTKSPTFAPSTSRPTQSPTKRPSRSPTHSPTRMPTRSPTIDSRGYFFPVQVGLTDLNSISFTNAPTVATRAPTIATNAPTRRPTSASGRRLREDVRRRRLQISGQTTNVPVDLSQFQDRWLTLRQMLHCVVDYVLAIDGVDLPVLRLHFSVFSVPLECRPVSNFTEDAPRCFPMIVNVAVEARVSHIQRYETRNVSSFITEVNKYFPALSTLGPITALNSPAFKRGISQFAGEEYDGLLTFTEVFRTGQASKCLDEFLNQTVRRDIEARTPTAMPTPFDPFAPSVTTSSPTAWNETGVPPAGGSNRAGLAVGLVFLFIVFPAMVAGSYFYWRQRIREVVLGDRAKDPLLPQNGSSSSGSLASGLRKNSRFHQSFTSGLPSSQLIPASSVPQQGDFEFSIDLTKLKLGKVIGSGANGRIFQARYAGSDVAVKELFAQYTDDDEGSDAKNSPAQIIKREFDNLRRLKHPHVIQLYGLAYARSAETGSPRYLLVMELAETSLDKVLNKKMHQFEMGSMIGSTASQLTMSSVSTDKLLTTHDTSEGPGSALQSPVISPATQRLHSAGSNIQIHPMADLEHFRWAMDIARQIASGLAFVHDRGLIHFDVKPHNILLDKAKMVKLCDLGISKMVSKQSDLTLTSPGRAGTPSYMSPELLRADIKLIGTAVDVYAFGIVLWQLLHLRPPHPKEWSIAQLFEAVLQKEHRPPIDPMLDVRTADLIQRCWKTNPAERPDFVQIMIEIDEITQAAAPVEAEDEFLADSGERLELEEANFNEGDKVQVFSLAVGLVRGIVRGVSVEGARKLYDVELQDHSMLVGVCAAELIPLKPSPTHGPDKPKRPTPLDTLDPKNATIGDVAAALAIARADERRKSRRYRRGSVETGSSTILPPGILTSSHRMNSSVANSPKGSKGIIRFGKRIWRSKEQNSSPSIYEMTGEPPRTPPVSSPTSAGLSADISKSSVMNMPALTPFSLRFLQSDDDALSATMSKQGNGLPPPSGGLLSQTFRYNGSVLEIKGLLVSESGLNSAVKAPASQVMEEGFQSAGSKYAGKLFKIAELGHGASGQVHSALHEETFEIVALKEVKFLGDRAARHQTVREVLALQHLRHPNVVQFRAAYLDPASEVVCIVLEYVLGGSLQDLIEMSSGSVGGHTDASNVLSPGPISPASTPSMIRSPATPAIASSIINEESLRRIAHDLTSALEYCHRKLVAHLDVKPSNVLLTLNGSAKLADFGLARTFSAVDNVHAVTFVGTTKYMSPERLKGENYSFPADIWGLGLSLAAAALGKFPIDLPSKGADSLIFFALLEKVSASNRNFAQLPPDRFSPQAIEFVAACLRLNPDERPTASQLLSEFEWMKDVPEQQPQPIDKRATHTFLIEIAEQVAHRLIEIESRTPGGGNKVIEVQPSLVTSLATQLDLNEANIRQELEGAVFRLTTSLHHSVLSDTMTSRSSKESRSSRVAALSDGGRSMKRQGSDPFSDTFSSLPGVLAKSPGSVTGASTGYSPTKHSQVNFLDGVNPYDAFGGITEDKDDDDGTASSPGLELHPL